MNSRHTLDRAYGGIPRNVADPLRALENRSPLHRFMRRVDWLYVAAWAALAVVLVAGGN